MGVHWKPKIPLAGLHCALLALLLALTPGSRGFAADETRDDTMTAGIGLTDFDTLQPPDSPNNWLVAPSDFGPARPDETAPVFDVSAERLAQAWIRIVDEQPRTDIVGVSDDGLRIEAEQRSAVFGFADRISARFVPLDPDHSTLVAYSRSEVGYWDFGVNRSRLRDWLSMLPAKLSAARFHPPPSKR
jgi:uncharacterized protein (DUF1499 family)